MATGKCPKCEKTISSLTISGVDAREPFGTMAWKSITLQCPSCQTVLGAQIDPIAIKTDIVKDLMKALRG